MVNEVVRSGEKQEEQKMVDDNTDEKKVQVFLQEVGLDSVPIDPS